MPAATLAAPRTPAGNAIRFEDVSFTYEGADAPALDHASLEAPAGATARRAPSS